MALFLDQFESCLRGKEHRPAYMQGDEMISLGEVNALANQFANWLLCELDSDEAIVGICVEPSLKTGAFVFGILKSGKAFLGLDPAYPSERIRYMVERSGCCLVLTDGVLGNGIFGKSRVVSIDELISLIRPYSDSNPARNTKDDLPAYVTFTSGSTGQPKAVLAPVRQVDNRFSWMWDTYPFDNDDVCCMRMPLSFVDTVWEILGPICKGIPVALISAKSFPGGALLVEKLAAHRVSRIWMLPAAINALLESFPNLSRELPQLTFWVCTGDTLLPSLARKFYRAMPHAMLFNLYGTSEVWDATWYEVPKNGIEGLFIPIGQGIQGVEVCIVDEHCNPLPPCKDGEIAVRGKGLALGYITVTPPGIKPFLCDGLGALDQCYRTGDFGRISENGDILFFGRKQSLIMRKDKIIKLVEMEAALTLHPSVMEGAVSAATSILDGVVITGYYCVKAGHTLSQQRLIEYLQSLLGHCALPDRVVRLQTFPMTPSGKIDRLRLQQWETNHSVENVS